MPPINGTLILLKINGQIVGSQRGLTVDESSDTVDFSSKDARERKVGYGRYESTLTLENLYVPSSSGYNMIQSANRVGTMVTLVRRESGVDFEQCSAKIDSVSGDFPDQGEATISVDFSIDGAWAAA